MATAMTACAGRKRGRNGEPVQINTLGISFTKPVPMLTSSCKPAVFSHEVEAAITRAACDYSTRITHAAAQSGLVDRPVRVYADGIYDMFHTGHARQLMQAKASFPNSYLIVGVCSEELTLEMKGRTVMTEDERYEAVRHCRYVDELVTDAPWLLTDEFLEYHKIDFVAHDDLPYSAGDDDDIYKDIKARGMFLTTNRTDGISTTDVIARIIKDYDMYVRRNLTRGYTAKDLNVSYLREKRLKIQENIDKVRHHGRELRHKGQELMNRWEYNAKEMINNFLEMFGREGRIKTWIHEGRLKMARAISPPASPLHESQRQTRFFTKQRLKKNVSESPPAKRSRRMRRYHMNSASEDDDHDSSDESPFDNDLWVENGIRS